MASRDYQPTDDDILRTRMRTVGVTEHRIVFEQPTDSSREWLVYDVGGARTQRAAWIPYFDAIHVILFLAPISCFDETLAEDPRVNRLHDSYHLWKSIVSSPFFTRVPIILFLNKFDLLQEKIARGVKPRDHMTSYGERANDANAFAKYLRHKFKDCIREFSPRRSSREFYAFVTSVVDRTTTAGTLAYVRDGILREHLRATFRMN